MSARPPAARTALAMASARSGGGVVMHRLRVPRELLRNLVGLCRRDDGQDREPPCFAKRIDLGLRRRDAISDEPSDLVDWLARAVPFDLHSVIASDTRPELGFDDHRIDQRGVKIGAD